MLYEELSSVIIDAAFVLFNELGGGFCEKVYENGLFYELESRGIIVEQQVPCEVLHKGNVLGHYVADLIVDNSIIVELKTANEVAGIHKAQLINYLRATNYEVGLVISFGSKVHFGRVTNNVLLKKQGKLR